jgi:hypothetical protein
MNAAFVPDFDEDGVSQAVTFEPVGPVARAYINDRMFISSIMGPYGSAKTTSCFQKILNAACWQTPGRDGVRRIRVCVIRATYSQLEKNVMKDWFSWFPKELGKWNGEQNTHLIRLTIPFLGVLEIEMIFVGLGEHKAEEVFKGMQLTLLWLNEVDTLSREVLNFGVPRVGRYPAMKDGGCAWSGVIADFNAPEVDNWTYDLLVNKNLGVSPEALAKLQEQYGKEFGINFHRQPSGRSPDAENLHNLTPGYYDRLILSFAGNENKIRRFVDNEFGAVNNGQPVYPEFNDRFHVAETEELAAIPGQAIHGGLDGGSTPALVFGQEDDGGQIRGLAELVVFNPDVENQLEKMGPKQFGRLAREFFDRKWPNAKVGEIWGDPAGFYGGGYGGEAAEDLSWMQEFGQAFGKKVKSAPAKGNRLAPRLEAVRDCLVKNVGSRPGMLIARCMRLRQGFNNGYVIQRVKFSDGGGRWQDKPKKNDFSHVHDAWQNLVLGLKKRGYFSGAQAFAGTAGEEARCRERRGVGQGDGRRPRAQGSGGPCRRSAGRRQGRLRRRGRA